MFDKLKVKLSARRVQRQKDFAAADKRINKNDSKLKKILLWPFRMIGRVLRWCWDTIVCVLSWLWELICGINLVGLLNLALIVAIIVLFSMLILDIVNVSKKPVVVMMPANQAKVEYNNVVKNTNNKVAKDTITLPLKRNAKTNKLEHGEVVRVAKYDTNITPSKKIQGDVIIESRQESAVLTNGTNIDGNLYIQNMRKYVLPCDISVNGSLFLRNVGMVQFCGEFNVAGNIYVTPKSSFGPLPRRAKIGGQIIM